MKIDVYLFNLINQYAGRWEFLDQLAIFFAAYFEYVLLAILFVVLVGNFIKHKQMVINAVVAAVFVRLTIVEIIRQIHFRARPFVANDVNLLLLGYDPHEASFPSAHAAFYFTLSTIVYGYNKKVGILFYVGSTFIVIARVFAGVHWPLDIIAGALLGVLMGRLLATFFKKMSQDLR